MLTFLLCLFFGLVGIPVWLMLGYLVLVQLVRIEQRLAENKQQDPKTEQILKRARLIAQRYKILSEAEKIAENKIAKIERNGDRR